MSTMERFAERFASAGFQYDRFYPCFGLAEATLFVSGGDPVEEPVVKWFDKQALRSHRAIPSHAGDGTSKAIVSCGRPVSGAEVAIVDPETAQPLEDGRVGEIWVSTPSAGRGYWGEPRITREVFARSLPSRGSTSFFRTGDLGFLDAGELFVSGRMKEMVIINGVNYYPEDLERAAKAACPGLRVCAAFTVGTEPEITLVLMAEPGKAVLQRDERLVKNEIRKAIHHELELAVDQVVFVKPGTIPRTTSGKIQRGMCARILSELQSASSPVEAAKAA